MSLNYKKDFGRVLVYSLVWLISIGFILGQTPEDKKLELVVQTGHSSKVENIWLSADGKNLISRSEDRIIIWQVKTGTPLRAIEKETVFGISANENIFFTRGEEGGFSFWEVKSGKQLYAIDEVDECAFNPDGRLVVCRNEEQGMMTLRNALTGEVESEFQSPEEIVTGFVFGFGSRIITSSLKNETSFIRIWKDGKSETPLTGVTEWGASPDGKLLVIMDKAKNLSLLNLTENRKVVLTEKDIKDWEFSPNGKYFMILKSDKTFQIQDIATGKVKYSKPNQDYLPTLKFSPNEKYMLFDSEKKVGVFDLENAKLNFTIPNIELYSTEFTPNGQAVAVRGNEEVSLYDVVSGKKIFSMPSGFSSELAVSADGKKIAIENDSFENSESFIWDIQTKQKRNLLADNKTTSFAPIEPLSVVMIAKANQPAPGAASLRFDNKRDRKFFEDRKMLFSTDAKTLVYGRESGSIDIFETESGKKTSSLESHTGYPDSSFTKNGKYLNIGKGWDFQNGRFAKPSENPPEVEPTDDYQSPYDKFDHNLDRNESPGLFTLKDKKTQKLILEQENVSDYAIADGAKTLILQKYTAPEDKIVTVEVWDIATRKIIFKITNVVKGYGNIFSPGGQSLSVLRVPKDADVTSETEEIANQRLEIWSVKGQKLFSSTDNLDSHIFDEKWQSLALYFKDKTAEIWNVPTKKLVFKLTDVPDLETINRENLEFSPDNQSLAVVRAGEENPEEEDGRLKFNLRVEIWSVKGEKLFTSAETLSEFKFDEKWDNLVIEFEERLEWHNLKNKGVKKFNFREDYSFGLSFSTPIASRSGKFIAFKNERGYYDNAFRIWNTETRQIFWRDQHLATVNSLAFSPDERFLISSSEDGSVKVWKIADMKEILTFIPLDESDWVVVDPEGRFDASEGAARLMQWRIGNDLISFEQLKERYYEPNLWQKLLGYSKEPLRNVTAFKDILLPPEVEEIASQPNSKSTIRQVKIKNKGGGIGRVQIFVNGREFIEDARDEELKSNPNLLEHILSFDLKNAPVIAGETPEVNVVAWNFDPNAKEKFKGYVSSRGTEIVYIGEESEPLKPPTLYAIIGGVSDYGGTQLDLTFAAKDAEDMFQALKIGGKNLFPVEKMKLKLLATGNNPQAVPPTKENFRKAFAEFASQAEPQDILFVYLSGHGITLNFGSDTYYYLTQEATTTDKQKLSTDSVLLAGSTVSSEELTEWHKSVKALKQVLILDTCAAGALGNEFKIIEKKELSTDAKRALERMKDRVGFHVLMGSAADAVSYEASQYGQGLLTYSLLQGMKGAALQTDGQVDVSKLFNYAADTVPELAKNIGGIQRPEIRAPQGGASFAVGLIKTEADKTLIPLAKVKPLILRPVLQNQKLGYDNLKLTPLLRDRIREASFSTVRGKEVSSLIFVDAEEMPDAVIPAGNYTVEGETVKITVNLIRNNKPAIPPITVEGNKNNLTDLIEQLFGKINVAVKRLSP